MFLVASNFNKKNWCSFLPKAVCSKQTLVCFCNFKSQDPTALLSYLALLGRNGRVSVDEFGEDSSQSLNAQRQRSDVQQQHVGHVSSQNSSLDGRSDGHGFIWVHGLTGSSTEQILNRLLDLRTDTCRNEDALLEDFIRISFSSGSTLTFGIRVIPPTSSTSPMSLLETSASCMAF